MKQAEETEFRRCDESDLAYSAGFFDGEGFISFYWHARGGVSRPDQYSLRFNCSVSNTNPIVVRQFQKFFGGVVTVEKKIPPLRDIWRWIIYKKDSERFLEVIMPFCILKKEQAELALKFRKEGGNPMEYAEKIKALKWKVYTNFKKE